MSRPGVRILVVAVFAAVAPRAGAQDARGPLHAREAWLPALAILTPSATAADASSEIRLELSWGSDFNERRGLVGVTPATLFLVDGEHRGAHLTVRRRVRGGAFTLGARTGLLWRGGGVLDGVIDWWHDLLGFPDSGRSLYPGGRLRVELRRPSDPREVVPWPGRPGTGLAPLELSARRRGPRGERWRTALELRVLLPTSTGAFPESTAALDVQALARRRLGARSDLHLGLGLLGQEEREVEGLAYRRLRGHGFVAFEWRPFRRWSFVAQLEGASRLLTDAVRLPGLHTYLRLGAKVDVGRLVLEGGFSEGLVAQDATNDFAIFLSLARRF